MSWEAGMTDHALNEVIVVRKRNRIWRMIQFAVVSLVTVMALMNVFVWQYVVNAISVSLFILVAFLYFVSFLECFNYYHFECPLCGMEYKTGDFEMMFYRDCQNCGHRFKIRLYDMS
jgi:hypothetical protein